MKIIRNFYNINHQDTGAVLTMGNFDGIHLGHQKILEATRKIAAQNHLKSALLTFEPHPSKILNADKARNIRIFSLSQKLNFLREQQLADMVFIVNFTKDLASLKAEDFVKEILVDKLKIKQLVVGYDFMFGKNKGGDSHLLEKLAAVYNFGFTKINASTDISGNIFSSTNIRQSIILGDVKSAGSMLGKNYQIQGVVIHGSQNGRKLGFPTANILPRTDLITPKYGVYKAKIKLADNHIAYPAIVNFGIRPTICGNQPLFEAHIFNFNRKIYGKKIIIELMDFIREEKKFSSLEELKNQIRQDCATINI